MKKKKEIYINFIKHNLKNITILIILIIFNFSFSLISPFVIQQYIDNLTLFSINKLMIYILIIILVLIISELSRIFFLFFYHKVILITVNKIKMSLMNVITKSKTTFLKQNKMNFLDIFVRDVDSIFNSGIDAVPQMIFHSVIGIGTLFYIFNVNLFFAIGIVAICTISLIPLIFINKKQSIFVADVHKEEQLQSEYLREILNKPYFVKTLSSNKVILERFEGITQNILNKKLKRELNIRFYLCVRIFFDSLLPVYIFTLGGFLFLSNKISLGQIIMCISLIPSITTPINSLTKYFLILKDIIPRFGRVFNAFKIPLEQERIQSSLKLMDIQSHLRIIEIKNVTLFFNKIKILDDISLTINRGDHVLIKGESGSGKTTIINVLLKEHSC